MLDVPSALLIIRISARCTMDSVAAKLYCIVLTLVTLVAASAVINFQLFPAQLQHFGGQTDDQVAQSRMSTTATFFAVFIALCGIYLANSLYIRTMVFVHQTIHVLAEYVTGIGDCIFLVRLAIVVLRCILRRMEEAVRVELGQDGLLDTIANAISPHILLMANEVVAEMVYKFCLYADWFAALLENTGTNSFLAQFGAISIRLFLHLMQQ